MKKLLYINSCIRKEESRTKILADYFLQLLDNFSIEELTLMDENLHYLNGRFFEEREELLSNGELTHPRFDYAHNFANADTIVIAAPFWDLGFPALLKTYIENICVEKITFGCNEKGMFGLCKAKDLVFITTRGGICKNTPLEMGTPYLKALCDFWGIENIHVIEAEGLDLGLEPVEKIIDRAKAQSIEIAKLL